MKAGKFGSWLIQSGDVLAHVYPVDGDSAGGDQAACGHRLRNTCDECRQVVMTRFMGKDDRRCFVCVRAIDPVRGEFEGLPGPGVEDLT